MNSLNLIVLRNPRELVVDVDGHLLPLPRVGVFDREAGFTNLWRVCRGDASELCSDVVDDVEIAVGAVVISQAQIGTGCLRV